MECFDFQSQESHKSKQKKKVNTTHIMLNKVVLFETLAFNNNNKKKVSF